MNQSTLFLVPVPIAEGAAAFTTTAEVLELTRRLQYYVVEDMRTARRCLRAWHRDLVLESIELVELSKHGPNDFERLRAWLRAGHDVGLMSEAGCPAVADPGSEAVAVAHELGVQVHPLVGPSSLLLALMGSGFNGQSFAFWGYLPIKEPARGTRIRELEGLSRQHRQTQLFIETPYRNEAMLDDLLRNLKNTTRLCVARNLGGLDERIISAPVSWWRSNRPVIGKTTAVFLMLG